MKILVLGSGDDSRALLAIVRSLGRAGAEVHLAWHESGSIAARSRYVAATHRLPPFDAQSDAWLDELQSLVLAEGIDFILPCGDAAFVPVQENRARVESFCRLYTINPRAYEILFDKIRTNELARTLGVRVPREAVVGSLRDAEAIQTQFDLPMVLKPRASVDAGDVSRRRRVVTVHRWEDFEASLREMLPRGAIAVQEYVPGVGVGVELLMKDGRVLLAFQHQRVHEPRRGGGSSYRRGVRLTPELYEASRRLLAEVDFTGVAMVEFKVEPASGAWALMEVNARFWGSLPLAIASGVDFPNALVRLCAEGREPAEQRYRVGVHCRNLTYDLYWQIGNLRAWRSKDRTAAHPLREFGQFAVNALFCREKSDTLTLDDPAPALAELRCLAATGAGAAMRRASNILRVRRLMRRRLLSRLATARSILFVCKGNVCRSPFAARVLERVCPAARAASAGYIGGSDRGSPEAALRCAAEVGISLEDHRSMLVTADLLAASDVLLVFDWHNYEHIVETFPEHRAKVFLLGLALDAGPAEIADPWGGGSDDFRTAYKRISEAAAVVAGALSVAQQRLAKAPGVAHGKTI